METATRHGVTVNCDLNYRSKFWGPEEAQTFMKPITHHVDVCIGNEEDAKKCLGLKPKDTDVYQSKLDIAGYQDAFKGPNWE